MAHCQLIQKSVDEMDIFKIKVKLKNLIIEIENLMTKLKSQENVQTIFSICMVERERGDLSQHL
jgi:hypothetical protein